MYKELTIHVGFPAVFNKLTVNLFLSAIVVGIPWEFKLRRLGVIVGVALPNILIK